MSIEELEYFYNNLTIMQKWFGVNYYGIYVMIVLLILIIAIVFGINIF